MAERTSPVSLLSKGSLRSAAAQELREAILAGRLTQGERLNELQLSNQLGVSRGPLREAFRQLEEEGLLSSVPHRGTFVARITAHELIEVLTLREHLEPFAMESALTKDPAALAKVLELHLREMHRAAAKDDAGGVADAHTSFHAAFYTHSGHALLNRMWERLEVPLRLFLRMHQRTFASLDDVAKEHEKLLNCVRKRDNPGLIVEIGHHLRVNLKTLLATVARDVKAG